MGRRWRVLLGVTLLVAACSTPPERVDVQPAEPTPRTTWRLRHTVDESGGLQVTERRIGQYGESTTVGSRRDPSERCSVLLSVPGQGGPENKVGEKVPIQVGGRPGLRSGAGAEGEYLMWQLADGTWVDVSCDPEDRAEIDELARAVRMRATSVDVPFALRMLPDGVRVSSISHDLEHGKAEVYLSSDPDDQSTWFPADRALG